MSINIINNSNKVLIGAMLSRNQALMWNAGKIKHFVEKTTINAQKIKVNIKWGQCQARGQIQAWVIHGRTIGNSNEQTQGQMQEIHVQFKRPL